MKYYKYTLVDVATRIPVSIEPAKRGPDTPHGLTLIFSVESQSVSGVPVFYGQAEDNFEAEDWMQEVELGILISIFKSELTSRSNNKRKFNCTSLEKDLKGLSKALQVMSLNKSIKTVDFLFSDNNWQSLTVSSVKTTLKNLNKVEQAWFSWNKGICDLLADANSLTHLSELQKSIEDFQLVKE